MPVAGRVFEITGIKHDTTSEAHYFVHIVNLIGAAQFTGMLTIYYIHIQTHI